tara:strand:- start:163 stop:492 length:330 start_codon:yes stop_codon:yes gene_type:complete
MKGKLTSYFIEIGGEMIRVVAETTSKEALESIGFGATPTEAGNPRNSEVSQLAGMPDHELAIRDMESKDAVKDYVMAAAGVSIDKRGDLDTVKAKALKALQNGYSSTIT